MKKDTHPKYHQATVTCACGNTFETGSTLEKIEVEVCSSCHPYFTGKQKFVDTARRVEKFEEKRAKVEAKQKGSKHTSKKTKRAEKDAARATSNKAGKKAAKEAKATEKSEN